MSKIWIQLARSGDILNILPLLWKDAQAGAKPGLVVAKEYASILEGCSYVEPILFHGEPHDIVGAFDQVAGERAIGREVICTQVNGPVDMVRDYVYKPAGLKTAVTTSYQKEQWRVAGRLGEWGERYPLVFDQRSQERENKLLASLGLLRRGKPRRLLLVSVNGYSSPFPYPALLMEVLRGRFGQTHQIIELPQAERIYDLLALYERAEMLVAIDSAPLHLARAVPTLPVVAFANDQPLLWNGSVWEPNHIAYCRYHDFTSRIVEVLNSMDHLKRLRVNYPVVQIFNDPAPKFRSSPPCDWEAFPITQGMCGRDSRNTLQDEKQIPYLRDCVKMAMQKPGCEFVCVTRADTELAMDAKFPIDKPCYAYRINRGKEQSHFQPVADLFYAPREWWKAHLNVLPDYIFGRDLYFAHGMWAFFKAHGALDVTGNTYRREPETKEPAITPPLPPRIRHNKTLCDRYVADSRIASRYPKITEQVEVVASFSHMTRFGYNPSITRHGSKILMAYRWHPEQSAATKLELAELGENHAIANTRPLNIAGGSIEDPKFFSWQGNPCLSWVDSIVPAIPFRSVVKYAPFLDREGFMSLGEHWQPRLPDNDGKSIQKNWVFFQYEQALYALYQCQPAHIVYKVENGEPVIVCETPGPTWDYGTIKGGTAPVPYEGKLLRFFHGGLDNEFGSQRRRYYLGALLMQPEPPFRVLRVSRKPILYGSEIDDIKVKDRPHHWKANVVFPGGVVESDSSWLVSLGINDSSCAIVKIRPEDLRL